MILVFKGYNQLPEKQRLGLLAMTVCMVKGESDESDFCLTVEVQRYSGLGWTELHDTCRELSGLGLIEVEPPNAKTHHYRLKFTGRARSLQLLVTTETVVKIRSREMPD